MDALLILSQKNGNARLMVRLEEKIIRERVIILIEQNRGREAFDILKSRAQVRAYYPSGAKLPSLPQVTLVEDLI